MSTKLEMSPMINRFNNGLLYASFSTEECDTAHYLEVYYVNGKQQVFLLDVGAVYMEPSNSALRVIRLTELFFISGFMQIFYPSWSLTRVYMAEYKRAGRYQNKYGWQFYKDFNLYYITL